MSEVEMRNISQDKRLERKNMEEESDDEHWSAERLEGLTRLLESDTSPNEVEEGNTNDSVGLGVSSIGCEQLRKKRKRRSIVGGSPNSLGTKRKKEFSEERKGAAKVVRPVQATLEAQWNCASCTFLNIPFTAECEVCLAERPAATYFQSISKEASGPVPTSRINTNSHLERPPTPSSVSMYSFSANELKEFDLDDEDYTEEDLKVKDRENTGEDDAESWGDQSDEWEIDENRNELIEIDKDLSGLEQYKSGLYKYFSRDSLAVEQRSRVISAERQLEVSDGAAEIMLRHMNWDLQALIAQHRRDKKELYKDAGCISQINNVVECADDPETPMKCIICFDNVKKGDTFAMSCSHRFCLECWKKHLSVAVKSGTSSGVSAVHLHCPGYKCNEVIPKLVFEMLLETDEFKSYQARYISSFVDSSADLAWCTSPKCGRIIQILKPGLKNISCLCGTRFCFRCGADAHNPATCSDYNAWLARDKGGEGLNAKYLKKCKPCPSCGVQTKKDGGCQYLKCANCRHLWCWQCGKTDHHVWKCNRPPYESGNKEGDSQFYLFYFERYFNHKQSLKAAEAMLQWAETTSNKIAKNMESSLSSDFLLPAAKLVVECRDVLRWTYVHAFYLKTDQERRLFEHRQGELEEFTEQLSGIIENRTVSYLVRQKFKIMELTKAISKYLMGITLDIVK